MFIVGFILERELRRMSWKEAKNSVNSIWDVP
jgi:hypothetical protein